MSSYRSSSQVSVYNYPEHLNPFYEDEQHKRLRFWKIKKSNNSSNKNRDGGSGMRRGSFNFGSLRDLFSMGSFRSKKQSSTLGINTTSESPPPLRREFISYNKEDEDKYASYDPHFRHTLDTNTFQRNGVYRSSLQNMNNAPNDLTFNRNNRYRSTIQNGSLQHIATLRHDGRYMYPNSITSTPKSRYLTDYTPRMTPGSSMNSISTNPFDDDYDDDNDENVEGIITSNNVTQTQNSMSSSAKKPAKRKKRRAPPPPNVAISQGTSESENIQIRITENGDDSNNNNKNGLDELSRLTAEFESFVKNSENDAHQQSHQTKLIIDEDEVISKQQDEKQKASVENQEIMTIETSQSRHIEKEETPQVSVDVGRTITLNVEKIQSPSTTENVERRTEHHVIVRDEIESVDKTIAIIQEDLKIKEIELKIKEDELRIKEALEEVNNNDNKSLEIEKVVDVEREKSKSRELSPEIQTLEVHQMSTEIRKFPEFQRITPTPTPSREETPDFIPVPVREKFDVLRIEENDFDYKKPEDIKQEKSIQVQELNVIKSKERSLSPPKVNEHEIQPIQTKILNKEPPIKEPRISRDRTPIPLARTEIESKLSLQGFVKVDKPAKFNDFEKCVVYRHNSQNDEEEVVLRNEDQPPKVPERRRSVKDIIESINRSQQLLKINQPPSPQLPRKKYNFGDQKFSYHEKPAIAPKDIVLLKLQRQAESERRINLLLDDLQDFNRENTDIRRSHKFPVSERDTNNNSTSFPHERLSRDDINPIPKPRRVM